MDNILSSANNAFPTIQNSRRRPDDVSIWDVLIKEQETFSASEEGRHFLEILKKVETTENAV
jgi:hypothetical protein